MPVRAPETQPPRPEHPEPSRLLFLDALRCVAALTVFLSHAAERVSPTLRDIVHTRFDLGHFGVTLFFFCSGFIIPFSLERQNSLYRFGVSRFFRLYPLYWFTIGISVILAYTQQNRSFGNFLSTNSNTILGNLTMFQLFLGISSIRGEYWTLAFELLFYIVMAVLFLVKMNKHTIQFTIGLILASLLVEAILPLVLGLQVPVGILSFLAIMFMGTTIYRIYSGEVSGRIGANIVASGFVMLFITTLAKGISEANPWAYLYLMTGRLAAVVVFGIAFVFRSRRPPRFMLYLGTISYSLYLTQTYAMLVNVGNPMLNVLLWMALLLIMSTATYRWIEQPGITLGQRFTHIRRAPIPAPEGGPIK